MKKLLVLLLLANLALFAYGYFEHVNGQAQAAADRYKPLNAEKIKSLSAQQVAKLGPAKVAQLTLACAEWGPLSEAERIKATQLLEPLALGRTLTSRRVDVVAEHWVYIPPKVKRATAERSMADLKKLGVSGGAIVLDGGEWNFAISLGAFLSKSAADARLAELRAKGVKTATYRQREQTVLMAALVLREPTQAMLTKLEELKAQVVGTNISTGACPEPKS
jgi:hypothetical protein